MNIIVLDYPISYIPWIYQVPSTSPISDQFPMDSCRNIYVVFIYNEEISLESAAVPLLQYKLKQDIFSYVTLSLDQRHPSELASPEEHCALFDQGYPRLEPNTHHHEVLSTTTPKKHFNFVQAFKGPNQVNFSKGAFGKYDNNISFGLLAALFPHENLPRTPRVIRSVLAPSIKKISDNI